MVEMRIGRVARYKARDPTSPKYNPIGSASATSPRPPVFANGDISGETNAILKYKPILFHLLYEFEVLAVRSKHDHRIFVYGLLVRFERLHKSVELRILVVSLGVNTDGLGVGLTFYYLGLPIGLRPDQLKFFISMAVYLGALSLAFGAVPLGSPIRSAIMRS